jgi:5'-nucleotidase
MDGRFQRHLLRAIVAAALVLAPLASRAATITILHVNDTHSHLEALGPRGAHFQGTRGGLAKAATVIARERATTPNTLLLHAGDLFQGDVFFNATYGVPELQLLSQLGLDAMAVGNHEFHLGPEVLLGVLAQAFTPGASPLLSANLDLSGVPALGFFVRPHALKTIGGVQVGIFGLTTPFDPAEVPAPVVVESSIPKLLAIAAAQAQQLRAAGADVVVCLSHMGFDFDQALAANVPGLDVVVGGHDHLLLSKPVLVPGPGGKQVPVLQAGSFYEWVGKLTLSVDAGGVSVSSYELIPVDEDVPPFAPFEPALRQVGDAVRALFGDVHARVAVAPFGVSAAPSGPACFRDTGAGNLITDATRALVGTELALTVSGLIPDGIARGQVLALDLFRVVGDGFDPGGVAQGLPFGASPLFTLDITGADLVAAIETTVALGVEDVALQVSGARVVYDSRRPVASRVVAVTVRGAPLDPGRTYHATVNFGVVQGLPALGVTVSNVRPAGHDEYEAVLALARREHVLLQASQGRVVDVGLRCR